MRCDAEIVSAFRGLWSWGCRRAALGPQRMTHGGLSRSSRPSRATLNFDCWKQGDFFAIKSDLIYVKAWHSATDHAFRSRQAVAPAVPMARQMFLRAKGSLIVSRKVLV